MKLNNVINIVERDLLEKGYADQRAISLIVENFEKISDDYDIIHVCINCYYEFNEIDSDNDDSEKAVAEILQKYKYKHDFQNVGFSWKSCPCCKSKLGGDRYLIIVFNNKH